MNSSDAAEAAPILQRSLNVLVGAVPSSGRSGADLRTACGALSANAEKIILADCGLDPALANCSGSARSRHHGRRNWRRSCNATMTEAPARSARRYSSKNSRSSIWFCDRGQRDRDHDVHEPAGRRCAATRNQHGVCWRRGSRRRRYGPDDVSRRPVASARRRSRSYLTQAAAAHCRAWSAHVW